MIEGVIYRYKSPSGKYYIGQTVDETQRRWNFLSDKRYGGPKIDNARKKYGPENFEYTVLMKVEGDNPDEVKHYLDALEIGFIKMYNSIDEGYNITKGGGGCYGFHHSDEVKERISKKLTGIKKSEETKKKMSEVKLGNTHFLGHTHTDEAKEKIGRKHRGKVMSEEARKKMSEHLKGRTSPRKGVTLSEETKKKISETKKKKSIEPWNKGTTGVMVAWNKGKHLSEETKRKISETKKKRRIQNQ